MSAYRGALVRQVQKRPGFRANDYGIWLLKEDKLTVAYGTVVAALEALERQGIVRSEMEPGPVTPNAPRNWYSLV